jgi:prepilin-type N-terminal cleavage/methylation domain-containing protein
MEEYDRRRQMKKAFTMIELVVAISLFIILSTISFMYFFSQSNKARD